MADRIRVAVIDSHPLFRKGLVETISGRQMVVVAEGETADDARRIVHESSPDILIIDISISGDGIAGAEKALRLRPGLKVIVLTASDDAVDLAESLRIGVHGYILKGVTEAELLNAMKAIHRGEPYITPSLASRLLAKSRGKSVFADEPNAIGLSLRDRRVLRQLARGLTNRELAAELGVNVRTIKYYLSQVFKKLRVHSRVEAILKVQKMRLDFRDQGQP